MTYFVCHSVADGGSLGSGVRPSAGQARIQAAVILSLFYDLLLNHLAGAHLDERSVSLMDYIGDDTVFYCAFYNRLSSSRHSSPSVTFGEAVKDE